ncbi:MAG: RHS repeat domain-containing protein, partial [Bacteriovoracia bacterium]
ESFIYTRDQIGNRTSITTTRGSFSYSYDNENQLVSASHPEADALHALETFSYDSLGNRLSDNQGSFNYDDKKFRLDEDYKYLYVYDLNGNLTSKQEKGMSGRVWNYVYNSENQMTEASLFEGTSKLKTVSFFYDAFGRRVKKAVEDFQNNKIYSRKYGYDSSEIIAELDEDNNVLATYTHSGLRTDDVLSADITEDGVSRGLATASGTYLYLKDGLGSVQAITDEAGNLVQRYIYSSFGKLLKVVDSAGFESTAVKTAYTYTNREIDEETGLYYYRARYYDPERGQFLTEDPHPGVLFRPDTFLSKYAYTGNSPTNFIDTFGEKTEVPALYGNYCGPYANGKNWSKDPVDNVDAACERHDKDYVDAERFESKWSKDNGHFAPELEFAEETYHYIYHRGVADTKMILELSFNPESWKDENGNYSIKQYFAAKLIAAGFTYKYLSSAVNGVGTENAVFFNFDKKLSGLNYQSRKIQRFVRIKL